MVPAPHAARNATAPATNGARPLLRDAFPGCQGANVVPLGRTSGAGEGANPSGGATLLRFPGQSSRPAAAVSLRTVPAQADPAALAPDPHDTAWRFTALDRIALLTWQHMDGCGYTRMVLEDGGTGTGPDSSSYALLYRHDSPWATWGLTRRPDGVLAWRCSDGASVGMFSSMEGALASLPRGG